LLLLRTGKSVQDVAVNDSFSNVNAAAILLS